MNNAVEMYAEDACRPVTNVKVFSVRTAAYLHVIFVVERAVEIVIKCLNVMVVTKKVIVEDATMAKSIQLISAAVVKKSYALIVFPQIQDVGVVQRLLRYENNGRRLKS